MQKVIITEDNRRSVNGKAWRMDPSSSCELLWCCFLLEMGDLICWMQIIHDKHSSTNEAVDECCFGTPVPLRSAFKMQSPDFLTFVYIIKSLKKLNYNIRFTVLGDIWPVMHIEVWPTLWTLCTCIFSPLEAQGFVLFVHLTSNALQSGKIQ